MLAGCGCGGVKFPDQTVKYIKFIAVGTGYVGEQTPNILGGEARIYLVPPKIYSAAINFGPQYSTASDVYIRPGQSRQRAGYVTE